ncbi:uncharacterized protein LOC132754038 [Ruditapes philippinarum]|uniref:uncharacterized protein LOC132754038 n=1 Tax=Ruditapes philippinarum TaxID=129788 RepID=UPI00295B1BD2|nr:uncharacterized protein LOC132754038 [Ruditapes philippinarum]
MSFTLNKIMFFYVVAKLFLLLSIDSASSSSTESGSCENKFQCEYNVLKKLIQLEEITSVQSKRVATLIEELKDARDTIAQLNKTIQTNQKSADGTTYVRWGRTTCPDTAYQVYTGYAAGSHYTHSGTAVDPLCLPKNPIYDKYSPGVYDGIIYGAEYETSSQSSWKHLHDQDIPCSVCRIPRNNLLMVPGRNICHENYQLEYKGYLMSSHHKNVSPSQFICIDDEPEVLPGGHANHNGKLFYFVSGSCGSLKCPPYREGLELTCAVCSYSPNAKSTNIQPYK